jgi:hypothetical protein
MVQVVEQLPNKHKALSLNPTTTKKKGRERERNHPIHSLIRQ